MLDVRRLQTLRAVAREGSLSAAARATGYTQPAISHSISRLEAEVGTPLLTRLGRDARGERIADQIAASGAVIDDASWTDAKTSTARARLRPDGSAEYEFAIDWVVPEIAADTVRVVHNGSIALFLEPGGSAVLGVLRRAAHTCSPVV